MSELIYEINEKGISEIIDESKGNTFIALREMKWGEKGTFKLDLRKWFIKPDGTEIPGKGVVFQTEEGPHTLTRVLLENGYGNPNDILSAIKNREDIPMEVRNSIDLDKMMINDSDTDISYYDPGELFKKGE